jgi:hypothetical protein
MATGGLGLLIIAGSGAYGWIKYLSSKDRSPLASKYFSRYNFSLALIAIPILLQEKLFYPLIISVYFGLIFYGIELKNSVDNKDYDDGDVKSVPKYILYLTLFLYALLLFTNKI